MSKVRRQVRETAFDIQAIFVPSAQSRYDETMPERMNAWLTGVFSWSNASPAQQRLEALTHGSVGEAIALTGHKEGRRLPSITEQFPMPCINSKLLGSGGMEWNDPGLVKLGFADEQRVRTASRHDIQPIEPKRF